MMKLQFRFDTPKFRVRLTIFDLTHSGSPRFMVEVLSQDFHPSTSFAAGGRQAYYGKSLDTAWEVIQMYNRGAHFPPEIRDYLPPEWGQESPSRLLQEPVAINNKENKP